MNFPCASLAQEAPAKPSRYEAEIPAMGVEFKIIFYAPDDKAAAAAFTACQDRLEELEQISSDYRSNSEIRRLCEAAPHETPMSISEELFELVALSREFYQRSDGAFDVTMGPVIKLWRAARKKGKLPGENELQDAMAACGFDKIELDEQSRKIRLTAAGMRIDFGGIGKGFAADQLLELLAIRGLDSVLIDAGGDIAANSPPPGSDAWVIQVARIGEDKKQTIRLSNSAIATSGDAFQFLEVEGKRYSHIIDPRSGQAVTGRRSVTVIAQSATMADAFASAINVVGFKDARKWQEQQLEFQTLEVIDAPAYDRIQQQQIETDTGDTFRTFKVGDQWVRESATGGFDAR